MSSRVRGELRGISSDVMIPERAARRLGMNRRKRLIFLESNRIMS